MSTIVTDYVYFDVNLVNANLDYDNMLCFDNIYTIQAAGGLVEGIDCGIDKTYTYSGDPIALGNLMDGNYLRIGVDRPNEFQDNCYHLVFEFSYTDLVGNTCSYFGELEVIFPQVDNDNYTCGNIEYAGQENCEFPDLLFSPIEQVENFQNSFQGTYTSNCDNDFPIDVGDIFPAGDFGFCIPVPVNGCTEIEMNDCPGGDSNDCVNAADLLALRKLILGITLETPNPYGGLLSDINQNGSVSTLDLVVIQRHILGLETPWTDAVGDCVIFDPTSEGLDGEELDGVSGWSDYDFDYTVEVCDGEDFEILVGVLGDVNGDCPCDIVDGLVSDDDQGEELTFTYDRDNSKFNVPSTYFYDMVLDIEGNINSIDVAEQLSNNALIEVYQREEGYTITINCIDSHPISLGECMSLISCEFTGQIEFTDKSYVVDENVKLRELDLNLEMSNPRSSREEADLGFISLEVINDLVFIRQKGDGVTELSLYTYEGTLVYSQEVSSENRSIDLSSYFNHNSHGKLFFIVGRKNGEIKVMKLIR
ncbi:MAG: dockerin type I domain-containing protein [Saprospiraceae bacterium]